MTLLRGDCLALLPTLGNASVDSIVTDPPYELGFMGKSWDSTGIAYSTELWAECLRVLKPGGHLLAFGGSRTYHRLACAVEDAGFEIRDQIMWIYGSGFPKSLDVSKAIDKAAGAEREDRTVRTTGKSGSHENPTRHVTNAGTPATPEAQQWEGWGTALKPAHEPIVVARKPLIGTVASNVLEWGTGALNIDGSRIGNEVTKINTYSQRGPFGDSQSGNEYASRENDKGRWPANVIHDGSDEVLAGFPIIDDEGSAARFFYCAKPSKAERNAGLEGLPERHASEVTGRKVGSAGAKNGGYSGMTETPRANIHPTVKPLELIRYLVRLVTPPNGVVLDPFLGSGTTACAAILEGFEWVGCEMTEDYWTIIEARVSWANKQGHHARLFT